MLDSLMLCESDALDCSLLAELDSELSMVLSEVD